MAQRNQYSEEDVASVLHREISQAAGRDDDSLQDHMKQAMDYYYNRTRGDEVPGESSVQSSDVADMVNAVLAQLTPMISTDALVFFEADGQQDEAQARMESQAVADVIMDANRGYVQLQTALKDACLKRNTYAKVWAEDSEDVEVRTLRNQTKSSANQIVAAIGQGENTEAELQDFDEETGEATVKVITRKRMFRWRAVDPAQFIYQAGWDQMTLEGIRFCAERDEPTKSELIAEGFDYDQVMDLAAVDWDDSTAKTAQRADATRPIDEPATDEQERVERHDCYLLIDQDGDGISEQWHYVVANKKEVLSAEMVQFHPFVAGSLFYRSHQLEGEDLFDRLKQTQDIKTGAFRRWLDALYNGVWPRIGAQKNSVDPGIEDARTAQVIWTKGPPSEALFPFTVPDIGTSCLALLEYADTVRTERGGAALDMQSGDAQVVGQTWRGTEKQYSVKEVLTQMMARNVAESMVRDLYLKMHRVLRSFSDGPRRVRYANEMHQTDPATWISRINVNVIPGLTPAQRQAIEQAMMVLVEFQQSAVQAGLSGVLVHLDHIYRAALDYLRSKGVVNPEQYLLDPASEESKQGAQLAQQRQEQQNAQQQQVMQAGLQLKQSEIAQRQAEAELKAKVDIYEAELQAEAKEAELVGEERARRAAEAAATGETLSDGAGAGTDQRPSNGVGGNA